MAKCMHGNELFISRNEFINNYLNKFEELFSFDKEGKCVFRKTDAQVLSFDQMTLMGWIQNKEIFQRVLDSISMENRPKQIVITEIESVEKFTESCVVLAERTCIEAALVNSMLPNFDVVCFDDSGKWGIIFDNFEDRMSIQVE